MNSNIDQILASVYGAKSREEVAQSYDQWAATYDLDMQAIGYVNPAVMVGMAARYVQNFDAAIFDAGVGTGITGQLLSILGYTNLIGVDLSDGMLARAAARKVYSTLRNQELGAPLDFPTASVDAVISCGTFTLGHAPAAALDELVRITKPGGFLIFTVSTAAWTEGGFETKLTALTAAGLIAEVVPVKIYHPMPLSKTESGFTTRAHVFRRT